MKRWSGFENSAEDVSFQVIIFYFPPECGGADAEIPGGTLPVSFIFSETGYQEISVDIIAFRELR